jgi:phospholipase C
MTGSIERTYGFIMKYMMVAANPFKKMIIQTECEIHKFINFHALIILQNDNYLDAHSFFSDYIVELNDGVTWADQNFKSSNHFYNPSRNKGLYGSSDALSLATEYYSKALALWKENDTEKSIFYLGAAVHLVQDVTVPQHANIRLLNNHRQYENFIRRTYLSTPEFAVHRGGYYLDSIDETLICNAHNAIRIYNKLQNIKDDEKRYYTISKFTLPLAQRTTAGCLLRFYKDISK